MSVEDVREAIRGILPVVKAEDGQRSQWKDWPEARTRRELIDPVLKALGWTGRPYLLEEYRVAEDMNDAVDYGMFTDDLEPTIILEAKRLALDTGYWKRLFQIGYYVGLGAGKNVTVVLTNGQVWEISEVGDRGADSGPLWTVDLLEMDDPVELKEQSGILYEELSRDKHRGLKDRGGGMRRPYSR